MIYFLTEDFLKDHSTLLGNVDAHLTGPLVHTTADMWIKPRLGSHFYTYLLGKYNAQTLNPTEIKLVEIIKYAMLWRVLSDIVMTSSYQVTNKGIQTQSGSYSAAGSVTEIGMVSKHYQQKSEFYDARLVAFLKLNGKSYPEFISPNNTDCNIVDITPEVKKSYHQDINFL